MHAVDRIAELRAQIALLTIEYKLLRAEILSNRVGRVGRDYEVVVRHHLTLKERQAKPVSAAIPCHSDGPPSPS